MAILTLKDGKRYQEQCRACHGIFLYDRKDKGTYSEMERYACPDCGHCMVAPVLECLEVPALPTSEAFLEE